MLYSHYVQEIKLEIQCTVFSVEFLGILLGEVGEDNLVDEPGA